MEYRVLYTKEAIKQLLKIEVNQRNIGKTKIKKALF